MCIRVFEVKVMLVRREKPTKPRNRDQLSALTLFLQLFDQDFFEKMQISPKRLRFLKKIEDLKKIVKKIVKRLEFSWKRS